jgi:hypothetical protein
MLNMSRPISKPDPGVIRIEGKLLHPPAPRDAYLPECRAGYQFPFVPLTDYNQSRFNIAETVRRDFYAENSLDFSRRWEPKRSELP